MLQKIRSLAYQHAIPAAFIVFAIIDLAFFGFGRVISLFDSIIADCLAHVILIIVPIAIVFLFGFSRAFKNGSFLRGLICSLPIIVAQMIALMSFFADSLENPETNWQSWYMIVYGLFTVAGIAIREECIYRATIQNILAKKYANSVKGIWITLILSSIIFGLCHVSNLFFGVDPYSVIYQVFSATSTGVLLGAVYLRSGNIWAPILVHALIDVVGLAGSTFIKYVTDVEDMSRLSFSWGLLIFALVSIAFAAFLLRPSKCSQVYGSLCFASEITGAPTRT